MSGEGDTYNKISGGIFFSAVIQGRDITVHLPPEITPALSGLPSGTPAFTGRDTDLRTLLDILAPRADGQGALETPGDSPASTVVVAAVGGLAGIGKTEMAVQAARTALSRGWFPGGVLFVDLFGYDPARRLDPGQALEGFLHALAIPGEHIPPHTQDRARLYASVLAAYAHKGRRILVVIDNAATHEQAKPLLPSESVSATIVTSRDTLGMLAARLLDLDTLTPQNAAHMLDRALRVARPSDTRVTDHPADALGIAELCGGLPLALHITAALLSENPDRSLAEMASDLADEHTRLDELSYANTAVRAAFELSYRRLHPDHARLFRLLTINPGPEISTPATAALAGIDQPKSRRGLEALAHSHLLEHGSGYGWWRMHDLMRLYARELSDTYADADNREQARGRLLGFYLVMANAADDHLRAVPGMVVFTGRNAAMEWLDAERPNLVAAVSMAAETGQDEFAMHLPTVLGEYFQLRRRFYDWLTTVTISRNTARRLGKPRNEGMALTSLGAALREMRRYEESITVCRDAAAIFRETGDRLSEGMALNNLGAAQVGVGRFEEEAITACRDAAAIFRENRDRRSEVIALTNLGIALREMRQFDEAITAFRDAAMIADEIGDWRKVGMALTNLGITLRAMRQFEDSITACRHAAAIFGETGDRYGEGMALFNLGHALVEMRRFKEAVTPHRDAATIFRETGDRFNEGMALTNLGIALREAGRVQEAITAHQDAAAIFRETGDRHHEGIALDNLESDRAAQRA